MATEGLVVLICSPESCELRTTPGGLLRRFPTEAEEPAAPPEERSPAMQSAEKYHICGIELERQERGRYLEGKPRSMT